MELLTNSKNYCAVPFLIDYIMRWKYKGEMYESVPYNWIDFPYESMPENVPQREPICGSIPAPLIYVPQWDRCYWLEGLRYGGNGNKIKAYLVDPYNGKYCYKEAKGMELVIKIG